MRVAVCFSGQMRLAEQCQPNIMRFLEGCPNVDFFIHTWDINQYRNHGQISPGVPPPHRKNIPLELDRPVQKLSEEDFEAYRNLYNPKIMRWDRYDDFCSFYSQIQRRRWPVVHYTWRKSLMYCLEYSVANNVKYDVVVKMRPDVIYPPHRRLMTEVRNYLTDTDSLYLDNAHIVDGDVRQIDDVLWLGSMEKMLLLSQYGDPVVELTCSSLDFIKSLNLSIKNTIYQGYAPLRPETKHLDVMNNFAECFFKDHYWYSDNPPMSWAKI